MEEVTYKVLDYTEAISKKSFQDIVKELDSEGVSIDKTTLPEEQLKVFMSILFVYSFHYDAVESEQRPLFLKAVTDEKLPLLQISRKFCLYLFNNLEASAKTEFDLLQKMQYNLSNPFSNERLLDFVEMELMDVSESYRKWEYGCFVTENLSEYFFKNSKWDKAKNSIKSDSKKADEYLQILEKQIDKKSDNLNSHEKLFLQLIAKAKLNPDKTNIADYLAISTIFQKRIFSLSLNKDKLVSVLDNAMKASKFKEKGKGGPRL